VKLRVSKFVVRVGVKLRNLAKLSVQMESNISGNGTASDPDETLLYASATAWPFFVYMSVAVVVFVAQLFVTSRRPALAGFILTPILLLLLAFDFLIIALDAQLLDEGATSSPRVLAGFRMGRFFVASLVVPLTLVCTFEIAYEVHKW